MQKVRECFSKIEKAVFQYFSNIEGKQQYSQLKAKRDVVTKHDTTIERIIRNHIQESFPDHNICGEEFGKKTLDNEYIWHIDPIDNTVEFISGGQDFSTSVSLKKGDDHIFSMIINPVTKEVFKAVDDKAFKNGNRIHTFPGSLDENARGISTCAYINPANIPRAQEIYGKIFAEKYPLRISGGAALDLCHIAEGKRIAHISLGAHSWDIEAGIHMVRNAGGVVEILTRFPERNSMAFLASASENVHDQLKQVLGDSIQFS